MCSQAHSGKVSKLIPTAWRVGIRWIPEAACEAASLLKAFSEPGFAGGCAVDTAALPSLHATSGISAMEFQPCCACGRQHGKVSVGVA